MMPEPVVRRVAPLLLRMRHVFAVVFLVPEALLIVLFLLAYGASNGAVPAALAFLPIAWFTARMAALQMARMALERARLGLCGVLCRCAYLLNPCSADALALCGALALVHGDLKQAEQHFLASLQWCPEQPTIQAALSGVLLELEHPAAAHGAAQQALALDARCAVAYLHLAEAERMLGVESHLVEDRLRSGLVVAADPHIEAALRYALAGYLYAHERRAEASLMYRSVEHLLPRCSRLNRTMLQQRMAGLGRL